MREPRDTLDDDDTELAGERRRSPPRATLGNAWRETKHRVLIAASTAAIAAFAVAAGYLQSCAAQREAERAVGTSSRGEVAAKTTDRELDASYQVFREKAEATAQLVVAQAAELRELRERVALLEQRQPPGRRPKVSRPPLAPVAAVQEPLPATPEAAAAEAAKELP